MAGVKWYRCPGLVSDKKSERVGKPLDGCWLHVGFDVVRKGKGGNVFCAHCGGDTMEETGKQLEIPEGSGGLAVCIRRVDVDVERMKGMHMACCYNVECSERYLDDGARGSDAEVDRKRVHSGTQYIWKFTGAEEDSWDFGADDDEDSEGPRVEPTGRSWRRCVFCGSLLKMQGKLSRARKVYKNASERDHSWEWGGPAATFRIYRQAEYAALVATLPAAAKRSGEDEPTEPVVSSVEK